MSAHGAKDEGVPPIVWFLGFVFIFVLGYFYARVIPEDAPVSTSQQQAQQTAAQQTSAGPVTYDTRLIGKWRSVDDPKYSREFKDDGTVYDAYEGDTSADQFGTWMVVDPASENVGVSADALAGKEVLKVTFSDGTVLYYSVLAANDNALQLSYLARGNTLTFNKVQ